MSAALFIMLRTLRFWLALLGMVAVDAGAYFLWKPLGVVASIGTGLMVIGLWYVVWDARKI